MNYNKVIKQTNKNIKIIINLSKIINNFAYKDQYKENMTFSFEPDHSLRDCSLSFYYRSKTTLDKL